MNCDWCRWPIKGCSINGVVKNHVIRKGPKGLMQPYTSEEGVYCNVLQERTRIVEMELRFPMAAGVGSIEMVICHWRLIWIHILVGV